MLLFLPTTIVLAVLFLLTSLICSACADHLICDDAGAGDGKPDAHGFSKFCDADPKVHRYGGFNNSVFAQYFCNNTDIRVADWNVLRQGILEVGTPCNGGGYARKTACQFSFWAACVSGGEIGVYTTRCRYFGQWNDCEWPGPFANENVIPTSMTIWHK